MYIPLPTNFKSLLSLNLEWRMGTKIEIAQNEPYMYTIMGSLMAAKHWNGPII